MVPEEAEFLQSWFHPQTQTYTLVFRLRAESMDKLSELTRNDPLLSTIKRDEGSPYPSMGIVTIKRPGRGQIGIQS